MKIVARPSYSLENENEFRRDLDAELTRRPIIDGPNTFRGAQSGIWRNNGEGVVNVKAFGAKGDGTTDDRAAIQAAIDSFSTNRQGIVYLPQGIYRITSALTISDGVTLMGAGASNSLSRSATIIKNEGTGHAISVTESSRFWRISDLAVQGQAATLDGIVLGNTCSHFTLENLFLTANRRGVVFGDACFTGVFRTSYALTNRQEGVYCSVASVACNALLFQSVFSSDNGSDGTHSGWYMNGVGFSNWISCSGDQNTGDGFEMVSCEGMALVTAESNDGDGFNLFECSVDMVRPMADGNGGASYRIDGNAGSVTQCVRLIGPEAFSTGGSNAVEIAGTAAGAWGGRVIIVEPNFDKAVSDTGSHIAQYHDATGARFGFGERWAGVSTPSNLASGNTNDYAIGSVARLRLTADAGGSTITGIAGGADGRRLRVVCLGNSLTLAHQDTNSTAANRILSPTGVAVVIAGNDVADLEYDGSTERWRVVSVLT